MLKGFSFCCCFMPFLIILIFFLLYNPEESGDFPAWALRNELSLAQCLYSLVSKRICGKSCDCLTLAICYSSQTLRVSVRCSTIEPRQCWILRVQNQSDSIYNKAIFSLLSLFSEHPMLPLSDWIVQSGSRETLLVQQNHGVKRNVLHWQDQVTCMEYMANQLKHMRNLSPWGLLIPILETLRSRDGDRSTRSAVGIPLRCSRVEWDGL